MNDWEAVQVLGIVIAVLALAAMVFVGWLDLADSKKTEQQELTEHEERMQRIRQDLKAVWAPQRDLDDDHRFPSA